MDLYTANEIINNKKLAFAACYALIVLYRRYDEQFKIKKLTDDFNSLFEDIPLFISEKSRICVEIGNNNDLKKALKLGKKSIELLEGKEHAGIFNNYSEIIALNLEKNTKKSEELLEEGYKYIFKAKDINKSYAKYYYTLARLQIIDEKYTYIEYLYDNYFIASDANSKLGIIDDKDNVKIQLENDSLQKIDGTDVIETTVASGNVKKLYSRTMEKICELSDSNVEFKGEYIKIFNKDDVKYFDKQGKELKNTEVYPNNTLFATKVDGKWGFANKSGTVVVEPKYDEVTEFNSYGYAAVKQDGKWGAINVNGDITAEIQYVLDDDIEPSFIGKYYQIKYGFGEIYYTNNET